MKTQIHIVNQKATRNIVNPKPDGVNVIEELIADEGFKLTQSAEVSLEERIIASAVMLGKGCSVDKWKEISETEATTILELKEQLINS